MGKKSIESLPVLRQTNAEGHYLRLPGAPGATQRLTEAVMPQRSQKRTMPRAAGWLLRMRSGWREEERDKYLREVSVRMISFSVILYQTLYGNRLIWLHVFSLL